MGPETGPLGLMRQRWLAGSRVRRLAYVALGIAVVGLLLVSIGIPCRAGSGGVGGGMMGSRKGPEPTAQTTLAALARASDRAVANAPIGLTMSVERRSQQPSASEVAPATGPQRVDLSRALGARQEGIGYAYTLALSSSNRPAKLSVYSPTATKVWLNRELVLDTHGRAPGEHRPLEARTSLRQGTNALLVKNEVGPRGWGFGIDLTGTDPDGLADPVTYALPTTESPGSPHWICLGPFADLQKAGRRSGMDIVYEPERDVRLASLYQGEVGPVAWRSESPGWRLRYAASKYADWFLSRGVLFVGLMRAGEVTGNGAYEDLVRRWADFAVEHLSYFIWEAKEYGEPSTLVQPVKLGNLDSCGSMGNAMADLLLRRGDRKYLPIIMRLTDYIEHQQIRRPDGTFGRGNHASQLVVDDLYMACPFLVRVGKITGDRSYYDDAVRQLLNFSRYLQDPITHLYHHGAELDQNYVYPAFWGRGNGWAAMAATEVLSSLPENHPERRDVWAILHNQLRGVLAVQAESGMWRQLLDHPDSYDETSGTAMFVYSLARAVNRGWVTGSEAEEFASAAKRAWTALEQHIQPNGMVTGTCVGAAIRRDLDYYYQLPALEDDDHGRGPVLMAGAEMVPLLRSELR